jgi:hypothetical protein
MITRSKDYKMKKLLIGLTLLASMSSFASDSNDLSRSLSYSELHKIEKEISVSDLKCKGVSDEVEHTFSSKKFDLNIFNEFVEHSLDEIWKLTDNDPFIGSIVASYSNMENGDLLISADINFVSKYNSLGYIVETNSMNIGRDVRGKINKIKWISERSNKMENTIKVITDSYECR